MFTSWKLNHENNILTKKFSQEEHIDRSVLPNTVSVVGSGPEEKVAKIFPKIIQTVKKVIFSFPILLSFFAKKYPG